MIGPSTQFPFSYQNPVFEITLLQEVLLESIFSSQFNKQIQFPISLQWFQSLVLQLGTFAPLVFA